MDPDDTGTFKRCINNVLIIGQCGGMAHGGFPSGSRRVRLENNHRFVNFRCGGDQTIAARHAFQIHADDFGFRIPSEIFQKIHFIQIQFVADAGKFRHADIFVRHQIPKHQPHAAALRNDRESSLGRAVRGNKRQAQPVGGIGHRHTIGTDEPDPVFSGLLQNQFGQLSALFAQFVETAGGNRQPLHAGPDAGIHHIRNHPRGNEDVHQIRNHGQFLDGFVHFNAVHMGIRGTRIDPEDSPLVTPSNQVFQNEAGNILRLR